MLLPRTNLIFPGKAVLVFKVRVVFNALSQGIQSSRLMGNNLQRK